MSREQVPAQRVRPAANAAGGDSRAAISKSEAHILRHSLGLDRRERAYRNFFFAGEGHEDLPTLEGLVSKGLMRSRVGLGTNYLIYSVTNEGMHALDSYSED